MTQFLNKFGVAPKAIAFDSDEEQDYLLTEAVVGEDGTAAHHLGHPAKLAGSFGEYLRMLHSLPVEGCPYSSRTVEMLNEVPAKRIDLKLLDTIGYSASDNVLIHGDYCLPNIVMDHFSFTGFIDLGSGGIGDRHHDLYWGIWTLNYNLKTDKYKDIYLDAYGRSDVEEAGLEYFATLNKWLD
jgi:kanamycin kinase